MADDVSPLAALVRICEALPQCHDADAREVLVQACDTARRIVEKTHHEEREAEDAGLSVMARRMLTVLGEQELHTQTWATATRRGLSNTSGTFCEPLKELVDAGLIEKTKKGFYRRSAESSGNPKIFDGVSASGVTG